MVTKLTIIIHECLRKKIKVTEVKKKTPKILDLEQYLLDIELPVVLQTKP